MQLENLVSHMMKMSVMGRLWHWATDNAQHHVTFESFLTQNETLTDSVMESAMGNDWELDFSKIGVSEAVESNYQISSARSSIKDLREAVAKAKEEIGSCGHTGADELITVLDDVTENCSKTLYLLKLK